MNRSQSDFVEKLINELQRRIPWLGEHRAACQGPEYLAFRIQSPHSSDAVHVWLDNGEITVGFGAWHTHFDESEIDDATVLVNDFVEGEQGVCERYVSGQWSGSSLVDLKSPDEWPQTVQHVDECIKIRGWNGVLWEGRRAK